MPVWRIFSPSLPPRPLKPAPSVPHRPQKGLAQSFPSHSFTAVVIDDDPVMRALIRAGLELVAGWRVILEPGAAPGIERVGRESPDVVVVDYLLPEMDGLEVCRRLKADPVTAGIPVVILTGRTTIGVDAVRVAGAEGVIFKPVDPRTLAVAIEEVIGGSPGRF